MSFSLTVIFWNAFIHAHAFVCVRLTVTILEKQISISQYEKKKKASFSKSGTCVQATVIPE